MDHAAEKRVSTPPGAPFLGALANLIRREEPCRLGARQFALVRRGAAMREADAAGIFHPRAKMPVQVFAQLAVAGHVDERNRRIRGLRRHAIIGHDLVVAAERFDKGDIRCGGQADHPALRMQQIQTISAAPRRLTFVKLASIRIWLRAHQSTTSEQRFRCDAQFGCHRGIANVGQARTTQAQFMSTRLEHDPDPQGCVSAKWTPVFPRDKRNAFARRLLEHKDRLRSRGLRGQCREIGADSAIPAAF